MYKWGAWHLKKVALKHVKGRAAELRERDVSWLTVCVVINFIQRIPERCSS